MLAWHKYKTGDIRKYTVKGELMCMTSPVYFCLINNKKLFVSLCNGVGSKVGFLNKIIYHLIPDFIGLLNITGCSDLHDVGFSLPDHFTDFDQAYRYFEKVNLDFKHNLFKRIKHGTHFWLIRKSRSYVALKYYHAVQSEKGWISFIDGKRIGNMKANKQRAIFAYKQITKIGEE